MASVHLSSPVRVATVVTTVFILTAVAYLFLPPSAHVAAQEPVRLAPGTTISLEKGTTISLATPAFLVVGKRYAFTWPGGGPPQTHTLKRVHQNGWVEVEVAEENIDPNLLTPGQLPTRWLNAALALSIQDMRPIP